VVGGIGGAGEEEDAGGVLVEPVDELGASGRIEGQRIEQAIEMALGLGAALGREAGGLVDDDRGAIAVDDEALGELGLVCGERRAFALGAGSCGLDALGGGDADDVRRACHRHGAGPSAPSARRC
jgi:hypothetical protein